MIVTQSTQTVPMSKWLDVVGTEYLGGFIEAGGSSVKVVSGNDEQLNQVGQALALRASQKGYWHAHLDPAVVDGNGKKKDLHRIDRFFFEITRAVDFKALAAEQAKRHLEDRGVKISGQRALSDLEGIALDNGREVSDLLNQYQAELATPQIRDFKMAVEFRTAVTALGRVQLMPDSVVPTTEEVLLGWFKGQSLAGGSTALKRVQIYDRIHQANARFMLESFCRWLPRVGRSGLVVTLDFRPYEYKKLTKAQRKDEQQRRLVEAIQRGASQQELLGLLEEQESFGVDYSDNAYQQMLALLRRFIDEIDWFERFLLVVLTTPSFYDLAKPRNYHNYDALQTRIGLEVRGADRANPAAALVHLGGEE